MDSPASSNEAAKVRKKECVKNFSGFYY